MRAVLLAVRYKGIKFDLGALMSQVAPQGPVDLRNQHRLVPGRGKHKINVTPFFEKLKTIIIGAMKKRQIYKSHNQNEI
jgi:hypothetical protein